MKTRYPDFPRSVRMNPLSVVIVGALLAMAGPVWAAQGTADEMEPEVKTLVCPTSLVELGLMGVSGASPKFGEYSGLHKSGAYGLGAFDLRGGDGYCQRDGDLRWQVQGNNLGTTSRNLSASVGEQGKWSLSVGASEMRHYTVTGYHDRFSQSAGSNLFTVPADGGVAAGAHSQLTDAYHLKDVHNERRNYNLNSTYDISDSLSIKVGYNHLDMSGAKLTSAAGNMVLMNPNESSTDNYNVALNWIGAKGYASVEYYGSVYRDDYNFYGYNTTPGGTVALDPANNLTRSTPPDNSSHQLQFTGGYFFSAATKLVVGGSAAINKQNDSFAASLLNPNSLIDSLDGEVKMYNGNARLTHQFTPRLGLNAGFKYNERENNTSTYRWINGGSDSSNAQAVLPDGVGGYYNIPMSNRKMLMDASMNYRISGNQRMTAGIERETIHRWCKEDWANAAQGGNANIAAVYYLNSSCAQSPDSGENRVKLDYRLSLLDSVTLNAGYVHANRNSTINPFYNPTAGGSGAVETKGFVAFFQASRREDLYKVGLTWQTSEKLDMGLNGRYTSDNYDQNPLGVQDGKSASLNFDTNYEISENASAGFYASWQRYSYNHLGATSQTVGGIPLGATTVLDPNWGNQLQDHYSVAGIDARQKLLGGKFTLVEDASIGWGKTRYNTDSSTGVATASQNSGSPGDITNRDIQIRLTGDYQLSRTSSISMGVLYQKLKADDYYYNGYAQGTNAANLLTGQEPPNYSAKVVFIAWRYTFQ